MTKIVRWIRAGIGKHWTGMAVAVLGCASFASGGVFLYKSYYEQPQLRYIPSDQVWRDHLATIVTQAKEQQNSRETSETIVQVEVAGAVKHPGVFRLSSDSRVQDALLQAGGFDAQANTEYIHQKLNLAEHLQDQAKIYIPRHGESISQEVPVGNQEDPASDHASLTKAMLMELPGVGEKRAEDVLAGVPYQSKADFSARSQLPSTLLDSVWEQFDVYLNSNK